MTAAGRSASVRRRVRLARGPVTIGEPAATIEAQLAAAEPYRPDTIADGGTAFGLTVRAASVRGLYKRYTGGPRQDDICLRLHADSGTLIAAVADGVSAAARSDLGAALAVRYATAAVARQLDDGCESVDWGPVFEQAAWALVEEHRRASGLGDAGVDDASGALATTLLVSTVRGSDVEVAAVGDSPALLLKDKGYDALVGEQASLDGLVGGGVDALPRSATASQVARCSLDGGGVLLLCTDGLAMPLAGGDGEVGATLARELARPPDIIDFARLLDFSRSTYDDDRSLIAVWGAVR
jgi:serine/threonine protein phosphatase PrpC